MTVVVHRLKQCERNQVASLHAMMDRTQKVLENEKHAQLQHISDAVSRFIRLYLHC